MNDNQNVTPFRNLVQQIMEDTAKNAKEAKMKLKEYKRNIGLLIDSYRMCLFYTYSLMMISVIR